MNVADIWDFNFFWQMFRNFMATVAPFVMIVVVVLVVGLLVGVIIRAVSRARS